jgi:uncharacterized oligopeptide transporter (OPT) family protein
MAASVAGLCGMGVLAQAMVWLGLPEPPTWQLVLYFMSIGMFGIGVGMLYTPLLVDRMQLAYPSGYAVANILRALTDKSLLRRSISKLGGGIAAGYGVGVLSLNLGILRRLGASEAQVGKMDNLGISASTFGAGLIVGARIAIPAFVVGIIGYELTPYLTKLGWLKPGETYRKIGFIISLGTIFGAALLDIFLIMLQGIKRYREQHGKSVQPAEDWKRVNMVQLILWVVFWGAAVIVLGHEVLGQPVAFLAASVGLCFLFVLVNGISQGISDWNPISSAFVMTIFILAALGLKDPVTGLFCAGIVFVSCNTGGDMQQDRSTGWRLGTNRIIQFRYQVIGIVLGAVLAVALAKIFMNAYPVLKIDQFSNPHVEGTQKWQSTMTFKIVGALKGIVNKRPEVMTALKLGIAVGLLIDISRKLIKRIPGYKDFVNRSLFGKTVDFAIDAVLLPSPYASSFGGFVELPPILWWTAGGIVGSLYDTREKRFAAKRVAQGELPADMSTMSLVGGGLIAGDSLAALTVGLYGMARQLL